MTIAGYDVLYLTTLVTTTFGALTFSVLALSYWRERRSRRPSVFAAFTITCAAAFLINLLLRMIPSWETPFTVLLDLVTGFVPPLLLHLSIRDHRKPVLIAFYSLSGAVALALGFDDLDVISLPFREQLSTILLGGGGALGLAFLRVENRHLRLRYGLLLGLTVVVTAANLTHRSAFTMLAPDYLLLAFFCVTLYYQERLIFFDLLIKRGAFFCLALMALTLLFVFEHVPDPVTIALTLMPLWLLAPWIDARLGHLIDYTWLRRRYSPPEAERLFMNELQIATTEADLKSRAQRCLADVFQGTAEVRFDAAPLPDLSQEHAMIADLRQLGWMVLKPRTSGIQYMIDDQRLFRSLASTLAVVLENVRFREQQLRQQEREQQLRLLASRAELKALRAQINPHFLFNALNAIAGLIPTQPVLADQSIEELAQVFRYTLKKSESEWVRLDEEAAFVSAYLRVEQARFGDRLQVGVAVHPDAGAVNIPAMCIQPLIENAVKHGASLVETGGQVGLRAALDDHILNIEVYDNGAGFPPGFALSNSAGHGLRNVAERLKGYYGDAAHLDWECGAHLTRVLLRIPCERDYARSDRGR